MKLTLSIFDGSGGVGSRLILKLTVVMVIFLLASAVSRADPGFVWKGAASVGYGTHYDYICGLQPSGCRGPVESWYKSAYPPQSFMYNVVWNISVVSESGPPQTTNQSGGFTLAFSYDADYLGTCCGHVGEVLHYHFGPQQWFFYTVTATPDVFFYISTTPEFQSQCDSCDLNSVGHPINPATGAMFDTYVDASLSLGSTGFKRFYNSVDSGDSVISGGWRHIFGRQVTAKKSTSKVQPYVSGAGASSLYADPASACTSGFAQIQSQVTSWSGAIASYAGGNCQLSNNNVAIGSLTVYATGNGLAPASQPVAYDVTRDDGQLIRFTVNNGVISAPPGSVLKLAKTGSGYSLIDNNDSVETYNTAGRLLSISSRAGVVQTMSYDVSGRLSAVTDNFGHQLTLGYDAQNRLVSVLRQ